MAPEKKKAANQKNIHLDPEKDLAVVTEVVVIKNRKAAGIIDLESLDTAEVTANPPAVGVGRLVAVKKLAEIDHLLSVLPADDDRPVVQRYTGRSLAVGNGHQAGNPQADILTIQNLEQDIPAHSYLHRIS